MNFINERQIKALPLDKKAFHKDSSIKNLYLQIYPAKTGASMTFYFRYKKNNKITTIKLGKYPSLSLSKARIKTLELNDKLESGQDLLTKTKKNTKILQELFDEWYEIASKDKKNKDFAKAFENHILRYCSNKKLDELSKKDIIICLDRLYAEGKRETIKRSYSILKNIMNFALHKDYIKQSEVLNIDVKILYGQIKPVSFRAITEISRFKELLLAIENYRGSIFTKTALKLSPYIFLRSSNMRNLKWSEVDFLQKRIILPANKVKGGEDFIVPLSDSAIKILKDIHFFSGHSNYVFPSDISQSKAMSENTLLQAIKRLGFGEEMVYHGFRSSASTFLYEYKSIHKQDSEVIELCLDHRERNRVKAIYNRSLRLDDRIKLMQWWSDFIDNLKNDKGII